MSEELKTARRYMDQIHSIDMTRTAYAVISILTHLEYLEQQNQEMREQLRAVTEHRYCQVPEWMGPDQETVTTHASTAQPPTTAAPTTGERWGAEAFILRETLELWQSGQATTEYLVGQLFRSAARLGVLPLDEQILALAARARSLTYPKVDSNQPAETLQSDDVGSPSGLIEVPDCIYCHTNWHMNWHMKDVQGKWWQCNVCEYAVSKDSLDPSLASDGEGWRILMSNALYKLECIEGDIRIRLNGREYEPIEPSREG